MFSKKENERYLSDLFPKWNMAQRLTFTGQLRKYDTRGYHSGRDGR
jgi:hypothetical protein